MSALDGRLALVTGASRGIGAAIAEGMAREGAHVVLTARTAKGLEEVEERIHSAGGHATIAPLDLTDGDSIGRLAAAIDGRWDALDMLVLNAATLGSLSPVPHIDAAEFARVMTLNVTAQAAMLAAFDPLLRASAGARVIGVTSSVATAPRAYWGAYAASKAAFENLLDTYAEEIKDTTRVRIAVVDPGATRTAMRARAFPGEDPAGVKDPSVVAGAVVGLMIDGFETRHRLCVNEISTRAVRI